MKERPGALSCMCGRPPHLFPTSSRAKIVGFAGTASPSRDVCVPGAGGRWRPDVIRAELSGNAGRARRLLRGPDFQRCKATDRLSVRSGPPEFRVGHQPPERPPGAALAWRSPAAPALGRIGSSSDRLVIPTPAYILARTLRGSSHRRALATADGRFLDGNRSETCTDYRGSAQPQSWRPRSAFRPPKKAAPSPSARSHRRETVRAPCGSLARPPGDAPR